MRFALKPLEQAEKTFPHSHHLLKASLIVPVNESCSCRNTRVELSHSFKQQATSETGGR